MVLRRATCGHEQPARLQMSVLELLLCCYHKHAAGWWLSWLLWVLSLVMTGPFLQQLHASASGTPSVGGCVRDAC